MRTINFTCSNHIKLLHCGAEFFPALMTAINAAKVEIYLETYIFSEDETGNAVKATLGRAASRGVVVNVITDWIGTGRVQSNLLGQTFKKMQVNYRSFNPWFKRGIIRTHRKLCIIDQRLAFLGGLNINDDLVSDDDSHSALPAPRWDFSVRIEGPLTKDIHLEAKAQWERLGKLKLKKRWNIFRKVQKRLVAVTGEAMLAGLVIRDNLRNRRTIQRTYLQALGHAHSNALLANPYFAPGRKLRNALASTAARGIDVTLLIGVGQFRIQDAIAHSFYPKLLQSGVKVVEYRKTQLHGKVAVIDDEWATVGSSNWDGLSLFVNQEANIVIKDMNFARSLRLHIEQGVADGVSINLSDFEKIPWFERIWYGIAFYFYKNILRIITLGRYPE
jgi:cardiolipin synthase A/B